ncbi:DNA cross-link repair protein SNM1 [Rhododendron vialii]|uniref:DNA cross-link repair protein SNM1 n=1 Tax=Rhododendron vialii TaxID=182163 RepID=UPI00265DF1FB|nr:DNA cross-link repair protein SNM1 [Rhododendron vialii]
MEKRSREEEEEEEEEAFDFGNGTHNNLDSSFSPSDSDHNFSSNLYASDSDYDDESHSPSKILQLDDNGFPSSSHLPPGLKHHGDDIEFDTNRSTQIEQGTDCSSFASDFYSCGTDCSSLLSHEEEIDTQKKKMDIDPKAMRKLKQTDLFQMWGTRDKLPDCEADDKGSGSSIRYLNNKKMKGLLSDGSSKTTNDNKKNAFLHLRSSSSSIGAKSKSTGRVARGRTTVASNSGGVADRQWPRVCPFYKKIPGTSFTVDAFRYGQIEGCNAYILSHFHADHYGGLSKGWSHGPIYCTTLTARLVRLCLYVNPIFIRPLEVGIEHVIEGIKVTMLEANHCPGAALIHFCLPNGRCYLHTGDFRASKLMHAYPLLVNQRVNVLYLDTTYCNPKYRFPSKEDVLSFVVRVTQNFLRKQPKTLIIVGAYSIGKECVYLAISKALGVKIYANSTRRRILQSFGWPELSGNLCSNGQETPLHVLPISSLRFEALEDYSKTYMSQYKAVLAFRPTGWTYSEAIGSYLDLIKPTSRGTVTIYGVPYSEHSSFTELREFVQFLRPDKIIPTVNIGNAASRDKMQSYFREWLRRK